MRLFNLARGIQPFIDSYSPEHIYKTILTNKHLYYIPQIVKPENIATLVFCAVEIKKGNKDSNIQSTIENNLFYFNDVKFGDEDPTFECDSCNGEGTFDCDSCGGNGSIECGECDGSGETTCEVCDGDGRVDCDTCGGIGKFEDGETCHDCDGIGHVTCDECQGNGQGTCYTCGGDGSVDCQDCNYGRIDCETCYGRGEIEYPDSISAEVSSYACYDSEMKNQLELLSMRQVEDPEIDITNSKTLLLSVKEWTPQNSNFTEEIPKTYANKTFIGAVINPEDTQLMFSKNFRGNKLHSPWLEDVPERFTDG